MPTANLLTRAREAMPELDRQVALARCLIAAEPPEQRARYEAEARAQMTEAANVEA